jgi:hypothetical protein
MRATINIPPTRIRIRAVAMQLVADLDGHYGEMHIVPDAGQTIAIACEVDSISAVQRHIERMSRECPEIATWT